MENTSRDASVLSMVVESLLKFFAWTIVAIRNKCECSRVFGEGCWCRHRCVVFREPAQLGVLDFEKHRGKNTSSPFIAHDMRIPRNFLLKKTVLGLHLPISRLQICPQNIFGNKPPQMVPMDLNIGETRVWRLDSGPNLQPWISFHRKSCGLRRKSSTSSPWERWFLTASQ